MELTAEFFDEVDGWRGFIAQDEGVVFDGVEVVPGDDGPEIQTAYGRHKDGEREEYTPAMRAKIERRLEAELSAKQPQFQGKEAA